MDERDADDLDLVARWLRLDDEDRDPVDVTLLFGGSLPSTWDAVARDARAGRTGTLVLVGGTGHTTDALRAALGPSYDGRTEADLMAAYLDREHGVRDVVLERASTDCGSNVVNAQEVVRDLGLAPIRVALAQEPTMQRRMDAVFRHVWTLGGRAATAVNRPGPDAREAWPPGRWERLVCGEVPRLRDDADGYGPRGRGFHAHVEVPSQVEDAHARLVARHPDWLRPMPRGADAGAGAVDG